MNNILEELINLEIRKRELENENNVILLLKLVKKYNTFYSYKSDCEEAILLERLIFEIKSTPLVSEYFQCVSKINKILEHISFEENGKSGYYKDLSTRKFILFKNR